MKKSTTKSIKPAPAQAKAAEPKIVEPKSAKKPAAPRKKVSTAAPSIIEEKTPAVAAPLATPAVSSTTITARIDIGFGNALFIRGEGAGLSWEKGRPLECVADDQWSIALGELTQPLAFKLLLNDQTWSTGVDYVVAPGESVTIEPSF